MRIGIEVGDAMGPASLDDISGRVREAAEAGLDAVWMAQALGWDALTALALASEALSVQAATGNRLEREIVPSGRARAAPLPRCRRDRNPGLPGRAR